MSMDLRQGFVLVQWVDVVHILLVDSRPIHLLNASQTTMAAPIRNAVHMARLLSPLASCKFWPQTLFGTQHTVWNTLGQPLAVWKERTEETRMSSGTNLFSVFSCVGSFWNHLEGVCSDPTCKIWECWLLAIWAIGYSDWLCAGCMTWLLIGGVLVIQRGVWEGRNTMCATKLYGVHFVFLFCSVISCFIFWITGARLAPPDVKEAYCISYKHRTYTLLWS